MPVPTRSRPEPPPGIEATSKIPSARSHQRTTSTAAPQTAKVVSRTHQRATSLLPKQAKVGETEPNPSSLLRKPSVRTNAPSNPRQIVPAAFQAPKHEAVARLLPSGASSKTDAVLRQPTLKPQFTSYQQHFSPKKPPRPASITSDTPSAIEITATSHESLEIRRMREELLHLQLLHSGSRGRLQRYERDAKTKLELQVKALIKQNDSILALEQHRNRCISHTALQDWSDQGNGGLGHKLLQLSTCVRDLDSLIAKDGEYPCLIRQFQAWFEHLISALDSRKQLSDNMSKTLLFVEPIALPWLQEVARIQWKLGVSRQILHDLGDSDAGGIKVILNSYQELANNLHDELDTCVSIHKIALEQEVAWIESSLQRILEPERPIKQQIEATYHKGIWATTATDSS